MAQPLLATDTVRFVGEPVAAVVTEDPTRARTPPSWSSVDYDPLPAVVGPRRPPLAGEVLLFEDGRHATWSAPSATRDTLQADLFDGCEVVVSQTIVNQRVAPAPMETRAAAAVWGEDGRLTAWIPNQGAQGTSGALAGLLGVDPAQHPGHHAGRRRRVRRQVRRRPGARRGRWVGPRSSAGRRGGPRPGSRTWSR